MFLIVCIVVALLAAYFTYDLWWKPRAARARMVKFAEAAWEAAHRAPEVVTAVPVPPEEIPQRIVGALWEASSSELIAELGRRCPAMAIVVMNINDNGKEHFAAGVKASWHMLDSLGSACSEAFRNEAFRQRRERGE